MNPRMRKTEEMMPEEKEAAVLLLDCTQGSRKDSFAKGIIAHLKEKERFLALLEEYLEQSGRDHGDHGHGHGAKGAHGTMPHDQGSHDHGHHSLSEVHAQIDALGLGAQVQSDAYGVYDILAAAEAKAHEVSVADVHFHEVGSAEAIMWVAVSCLVMRQLMGERHITHVVATPVCTGYGYVDCAHGRLPIPAPATANVLEGAPTFAGDTEGELTTPTGAALVVYYAQQFLDPRLDGTRTSVEDADAYAAVCVVGA